MAEIFFDNPPTLSGKETEQLQQLYRYLCTISQQLNTALMDITIDQLAPETKEIVTAGGGQALAKQESTLKSLIIKTAQIVRTEMDEIRTTLQYQVNAVSDQFWALNTQLTNRVTLTAEGLQQAFDYIEQLEDYAEDNREYREHLNQYVNIGVVRYDEQDNPVIGIAIGENITNPDGTINQNNRLATFTVDRLSFYQGAAEVAYFANNIFHISNGEITSTLKMGNHTWKRMADGALALIAG